MRIVTLEDSGEIYTSQVYLVLGASSRLEDVNTLVDVGQAPAIFESIERAPTGVGKRPMEQVVLTRRHSSNAVPVPEVRATFRRKAFALSPSLGCVDCVPTNGDTLKIGDAFFDVIHMPGHTGGWACSFSRTEGAPLAGDSPLRPGPETAAHGAGGPMAMEGTCFPNVRRIYFGYGVPPMGRCDAKLRESYRFVAGSRPAYANRQQVHIQAPAAA